LETDTDGEDGGKSGHVCLYTLTMNHSIYLILFGIWGVIMDIFSGTVLSTALLHCATWVYMGLPSSQISVYVLTEVAMETMFNYDISAGSYNVL
jgi:hypothetical protein